MVKSLGILFDENLTFKNQVKVDAHTKGVKGVQFDSFQSNCLATFSEDGIKKKEEKYFYFF